MRCTYEKTVFENADSGYGVMVFLTQDTSIPEAAKSQYGKDGLIRFTATGYRLPSTKAIDLDLHGQWKKSKYGVQFEVETFTEIIPHTKDGIIGYLSSGLITGIGPKTAKIIVGKFGLQTLDILDRHPDRLLEIKGISESKLKKIVKSYNQNREIRDIVSFLSPFGITIKKALKIYKEFGARTMDVFKKTPFELCTISGFGFKTVDAIARKTACRPNDPMRIRGAIHYIMDDCKSAGHLFVEKGDLGNKAHLLLNDGFPYQVVSAQAVNAELYVMVVTKILLAESGNIYKSQNLFAEDNTARRIAALLLQMDTERNIDKELMDAQKALGITLALKQLDAVKACFSNLLTAVTGGPGTGKTTILKVILSVHKRLGGGKVLLMAPTGRAARRMSESTGYPEAMTMHSALGLVADGDDVYETDSVPLDVDLIIVDEYSMVDMFLANEMFNRIQKGSRVLLVGDADQLPSVGPGNVFRELLECGRIPTTILDVVYRQAGTSNIITNAAAIREGSTKLQYGDDFMFESCEDSLTTAQAVQRLYMQEISERGIENVQILSSFRSRGNCSVKTLNEEIRESVNPAGPKVPEVKVGSRVYRLGDRVMQTKNKGEISNGDVGFITDIYIGDDNDSTVTITFTDNRVVEYNLEDLDIVEPAFAVTIHKSQGSEYQTVIIPLIGEFAIMMRRNLIYTAITRAKKKVILVGQKKMLFMAIRRNDTDQRNTMLGTRIIAWMDKLTMAFVLSNCHFHLRLSLKYLIYISIAILKHPVLHP